MPQVTSSMSGDRVNPDACQPAGDCQRQARSQTKRHLKATTALAILSIGLSGCSAPIIGALTLGQVTTIAGIASSFMSGRDLTEHALSAATGKDCRLLESILRSDRNFCEEPGSEATQDDFKGVIALLEDSQSDTQTAFAEAAAIEPAHFGFAPVDRRIDVKRFTLDNVAQTKAPARAERLSFGMLQASYGQTWSYEMTAKKQRVARAEPKPLVTIREDGKPIVPDPETTVRTN